MGALALATEPPTQELLDEKPHGREAALITKCMWKHITLQVSAWAHGCCGSARPQLGM
jgi:Ca2+-transporting ATPase